MEALSSVRLPETRKNRIRKIGIRGSAYSVVIGKVVLGRFLCVLGFVTQGRGQFAVFDIGGKKICERR